MDDRIVVLTNAPLAEKAEKFLTDRDKFPMLEMLTGDVAKARRWQHYIAAHRFRARLGLKHPELMKQIGQLRPIKIAPAILAAAMAADQAAGAAIAPAAAPPLVTRAKPIRKPTSSRRGKLDPNIRTKRANRKRAVRKLRKALGKSKGRAHAKAA